MTFTGLAHVALRCTDIDRSIAFYRDVFGFREMFRLDQDDGRLWLVYMHVTDTTYLELFPDGDGREVPGKDATGFNHLCIETSDIDAAVAQLADHGIPLVKPLTTGTRPQPPVLDRRSGRKPHRNHGDGGQLAAVAGAGPSVAETGAPPGRDLDLT